MAEITAAEVMKLRGMTNAGPVDCKKALVEANGDIDLAAEILRKKGIAGAVKKDARTAKDGLIVQVVQPGARQGILVEVNCETDFVARNETFRAFCDEVARTLIANPQADLEPMRQAQVAKIGEKIVISRSHRMEVEAGKEGMLAAYIHTGGKVGVLVEVGCGKKETTAQEDFKQLVRDITLQIAALDARVVSRESVPADILEKEKEIAAEQVKNKPPQAIAKIVEGKLEKFYQVYCLVDQGFVKKNGEITVKEHVAAVGKQLGDEVAIRRFVRFQVGRAD